MAIEAAVTQYRKDFVPAFEQKASMLRMAATKESVVNGNQATFVVTGSGGDTAVTRGTNGLIPYGNPTNNQYTATLVEKHAPYELTGFNVFASQGDQIKGMRNASINVINRDIDLTMLSELSNATQDFNTGTNAVDALVGAQAILGNSDVDVEEEDNMFAIISPAFRAALMGLDEFSSADYVDMKVYAGPARKVRRFAGMNLITSSRVTGKGTASEELFVFHRSAIGYAINVGEDKVFAGYDEKQDLSWSRATVYHAAKILQNSGIVKITWNGSGYVAT
ncbi:phage capsid protein [Pelagibacterium luteolum]|uniref:Major capsid protein, N4-gp56 family n=1 Tax=Pelagibacterium luteolum TaxID=440168 RepID=A0A1G7ZIC4_9HYPH|nr:phage capsid protein [Pelagibacterium luteolum]SDH08389.1 hypothetical protein SAMN04487974_12033 [Pelagibacterium luteolum]